MKRLGNSILVNLGLVILINLILLCSCILSAQNKRAFLVGISDYQSSTNNTSNSWENIHGANDVDILTPTLQKHGFKTTTIVNQQATGQNIRKQLSKFSSSLKSGDIDGNHPITINNTYYFEKIGWTGLAFEPLKGIIACGGTINPMLAL